MASTLVKRMRTDAVVMDEVSASGLLVMATAGLDELEARTALLELMLTGRDVALAAGVVCLGVSLLGHVVDLPVAQKWTAKAAAALGFTAVALNGVVAGRSLVADEGLLPVAGFTVVVAAGVTAAVVAALVSVPAALRRWFDRR